MQADRFNAGKPLLSLVFDAPEALQGAVRVLEYGLAKYGRDNWRKGFPHTDLADSLLRHLGAWLGGEDNDREDGLPHVDHISVNALFLAEMVRIHPELDNRSSKPKLGRDIPDSGIEPGSVDAAVENLLPPHPPTIRESD